MRKCMEPLAWLVGACLVAMAFGTTLATARDNQLAGITITPVPCFTPIDGDTEVAGKQLKFFLKLANTGVAAKTVKPSFDLPIEAKPAASATIKVSPALKGGCEQAATGLKKAVAIICNSSVVAAVGIRRWSCSTVSVPAGSWRLVAFAGSFGKTNGRWIQFWTTSGGLQTQHRTINID